MSLTSVRAIAQFHAMRATWKFIITIALRDKISIVGVSPAKRILTLLN